jgi:hypothetical protein
MVNDEFLQPNGTGMQPADLPSLLDAFIVTVEIFKATEGAWRTGQTSPDRLLRLSELIEALQLKEKMDQIEKSLPPHLQGFTPMHLARSNNATTNTPQSGAMRNQASAVAIRYASHSTKLIFLFSSFYCHSYTRSLRLHHARLVALRPTVLAAARYASIRPRLGHLASRTEVTLWNEVATAAVETALAAISFLDEDDGSANHAHSSNIVHIVLLASTTLIAASLIPEQDMQIEEGRPNSHYNVALMDAVRVLHAYQWQAVDASRAATQLQQFYDTVLQLKQRNDAGEFQTYLTSNQGILGDNCGSHWPDLVLTS